MWNSRPHPSEVSYQTTGQQTADSRTKYVKKLTKDATINTRRMNEVNQIDVTNYDIWNPSYKGKNYDPNY